MSPILFHRSSLESQKSVAVFDGIGSYRTSSTVSTISSRRLRKMYVPCEVAGVALRGRRPKRVALTKSGP
jgi:hypothetical protein